MKITIDTKEDSVEDIRKVVALLSGIIGKQETQEDVLQREDQPVASMFGMFDNAVKRAEEEKVQPRVIHY